MQAATRRALESHFRHARFHAPATGADLKRLQVLLGDAGRELRAFYSATNGFDLYLEGAEHDDGDVFSIERSLSFYPVVDDSICGFADRLIPLRADGCGNYDSFLATRDFDDSPIVFWDRESPDGWSVLLASSLDRYFELLPSD